LGGILLFRGIFEPYTKRRKLNIALREKNNQCFAAREKSEYLATSKSTFFSTVSPELRTPLYGVVGLSTILLEDPNLKSHNQDLKSLKFSADYLLALINDVLQIKWILTTLTRMKASLMDLNMPEMDGCEATKIIRELNKQIPIITLTALDIAEVRNDIYLAGMNDINSKPHEITEFTRVILKNLKDSKVVVSK
jgi:CheY-like chemotaxis protein